MGDFVGTGPITWKDFSANIISIALHPQAKQVAVGLANGTVSLRSFETGAEVARMPTEKPGKYGALTIIFWPWLALTACSRFGIWRASDRNLVSSVLIGENAERPGREWNGLIDDVRIYS